MVCAMFDVNLQLYMMSSIWENEIYKEKNDKGYTRQGWLDENQENKSSKGAMCWLQGVYEFGHAPHTLSLFFYHKPHSGSICLTMQHTPMLNRVGFFKLKNSIRIWGNFTIHK